MRRRAEVKRPLVLVTAGPTREHIDPIRFISNHSTGAFGYEIAREALRRRCRVVLVSGPTFLKPPEGAKFIQVESALDMLKAVKKESQGAEHVFMAAAVSDWRPDLKRSGL
jgi:phosphopantothenoylcysteine decarboxylase/phosphopantothenate--cysteine ligase